MKPKPYRAKSQESYTLGVYPTLELLCHRPDAITGVWLHASGERNAGVAKIREHCHRDGIPCQVDNRLVERLAPMENCFALGVFRIYEAPLDPGCSHLLLVQPEDLGNLGTIARTMVAFGWLNLAIVRPAPDLFHPKAVRASMGAIFQLRFQYFHSFREYGEHFPRSLYTFRTDGARELAEVQFPSLCTLAFGAEGAGLPEEVSPRENKVRIRFASTVDSLSLPVSVGIALYQTMRDGQKCGYDQ